MDQVVDSELWLRVQAELWLRVSVAGGRCSYPCECSYKPELLKQSSSTSAVSSDIRQWLEALAVLEKDAYAKYALGSVAEARKGLQKSVAMTCDVCESAPG